ncbi:LON peptidase substrate-binding domain-containing protein [Marivirga sp. S37H4]|uniref:LON peptidase substrate-binding domain-containing protein n=1 Tax=Marivirga aurantiaca TaxID=2802615 RepID=A0A934WWQ4_9BACT|nr:LON peptidase substrate-binding domain-containing protein [Marivirga aurantiaca]MBK6264498.1 LON peptidase substrate-binding domain-containing protein [Marivirga aurantiaca]
MKTKLPFFPLNLVAFPGQQLNLHVFEPRYKELVADCIASDSNFAIPSYVKNKVEYGTEMKITNIAKRYEDGRYDIETIALSVLHVLNMENPFRGKLYAAGEVEILTNVDNGDVLLKEELFKFLTELYQLVEIQKIPLTPKFKVFDIAHQTGLSKEAEYDLLQIREERKRQRFLLDHLKAILPQLREIQRNKELVKMNGHFRHYNPLEF